jgi:hypothetical protein
MANAYEIPLKPSQPSIFNTTLDGTLYFFRLTFNTGQNPCWILDIADSNMDLIVAGIPLVSGSDLLAQYRYLGFTGSLVVTTDRGAGEVPGFDDLGVTGHLFYISDVAA